MIVLLLLLCLCPGPPALVAFGDSITVGNAAGAASLGYAALYAAEEGYTLDNEAEGGTTVAQQVEKIRLYQGGAGVAIWLVCANDLHYGTAAGAFGASVQEGVDILRGKGIAVVLNQTCLPFPRADDPKLVQAYNSALTSITGAQLIPLSAGFPSTLFPDGTHLSSSGHRALANAYEGRWRVWMPRL